MLIFPVPLSPYWCAEAHGLELRSIKTCSERNRCPRRRHEREDICPCVYFKKQEPVALWHLGRNPPTRCCHAMTYCASPPTPRCLSVLLFSWPIHIFSQQPAGFSGWHLLTGDGGWTISVLSFSSSVAPPPLLWRADSWQKKRVYKSTPTSFFFFFPGPTLKAKC